MSSPRRRSHDAFLTRDASPITRRAALAILSAPFLGGCGKQTPQRPAREEQTRSAAGPDPRLDNPNIVILLGDTLRPDYLGCYGNTTGASPNIDVMAAEGLRFKNAYANAPWTLPSHASLFTGFPPKAHGQTHAAVHRQGARRWVDTGVALPRRFETIASTLKGIGYQTHGMSQNVWVGSGSTQDYGFDRFWPLWNETWKENVDQYVFSGAGAALHKTAHFVRRFLREFRNPDQPFFLFINNMICHLPYTPPDRLRRRFVDGPPRKDLSQVKTDTWLLKKQAGDLGEDEMWHLRDLYQAEVAAFDEAVGQIVRELKREKLLDTTLFVVTSDHGECIGHHGFFDHLFNMFDDLLRVPLIIRHPKLPAGRVRRELVQLTDMFPTILQLLGRNETGKELKLPGRPLPLDRAPDESDRPLFFLFRRGSPVLKLLAEKLPPETVARLDCDLFGVRWGDWKLVVDHNGAAQLYNVAEDPAEEHNRADSANEMRGELTALLAAEFGNTDLPFPGP